MYVWKHYYWAKAHDIKAILSWWINSMSFENVRLKHLRRPLVTGCSRQNEAAPSCIISERCWGQEQNFIFMTSSCHHSLKLSRTDEWTVVGSSGTWQNHTFWTDASSLLLLITFCLCCRCLHKEFIQFKVKINVKTSFWLLYTWFYYSSVVI